MSDPTRDARIRATCAEALALHLVGRSYAAIAEQLDLGWAPIARIATARAERSLGVKAGAIYAFDPLDLERRRAEDDHFDALAAAYGWPDGYLDDLLAGSDDDTPQTRPGKPVLRRRRPALGHDQRPGRADCDEHDEPAPERTGA